MICQHFFISEFEYKLSSESDRLLFNYSEQKYFLPKIGLKKSKYYAMLVD